MTPEQKALAGAALLVAGSWLLHEAYERHGRRRPWAVKWLPGA